MDRFVKRGGDSRSRSVSAFGDSEDSASIRSSTPGPSGAARPVSQMSGITDISDSHSPSQSFQASVDDKDDSGADTEEEETQERREGTRLLKAGLEGLQM